MTDPYPAIRREVERLLACHFYDADERSAAIAALNSRVEALMLRAAYAADETAWGMRGVVTSLLNEEPDE